MAEKRILSFFKVFHSRFHAEELELPKAFAHYMNGNIPEVANMRDTSGKLWPVRLVRVAANVWAIQNGWANFAREYNLETFDIITFEYDGGQTFDITVVGVRTSCGKKPAIVPMPPSDPPQAHNEDPDDLETEIADKSEGEEMSEDEPEEKRPQGRDWFGVSIFKSGRYQVEQPENPYFVTDYLRTRAYQLRVPLSVVSAFSLELPPNPILRDPSGRTWPMTLKIWGDGRAYYSGGWSKLGAANSLQDGDRCIVEFQPAVDASPPIIQVQIVSSA